MSFSNSSSFRIGRLYALDWRFCCQSFLYCQTLAPCHSMSVILFLVIAPDFHLAFYSSIMANRFGAFELTTRRRLRECLLQAIPSVLMAHANNSQDGDWGMPIASKPESVDGPRQQLTTRRRLRQFLLQANPSVLMAHANNSQQEGDWGNAYCQRTRVGWWPTPTTHQRLGEFGTANCGQPKFVDEPHQQLTTN